MNNSMKDRPPERDRRFPDNRDRRFEANLALVMVATLSSLWVLLDRSASSLNQAAATDAVLAPASSLYAFLAICGVICLNFVFVRAETSLELVKPLHMKRLREDDPKKAELLQKLIDGRPRYVAACNLGSQVSRVALVVISFMLAPGLAAFLSDRTGLARNYGTIILAAIVIMIPVGLFNLILGELVPKNLGALYPERVTKLYRFVRIAGVVFAPLAELSTWVANIFTARFGAKATFDVGHQAEEEIKTLVETAQESGAIEHEERELLHSVFEFTDTVAREVMTPRVDMDAVSLGADPGELIDLIQESGHSRIPVYEETDDQIVGIVHAKDVLLAALGANGQISLRELKRDALFVPENKNLHELLAEMRASRSQLAVVQDEFGGTAGIVTIEDIIEELVGDIQDEYDIEEPAIVEEQGSFLIDGKTHLDDVNALLGSDFSSDVFDTVGGFVFGLFGRQPKDDDVIEEKGYRFTVAETDGRRIGRLRVARLGRPSAEDEAADSARRAANG